MDKEKAEAVANEIMGAKLQQQKAQVDRLQRLTRHPRLGKFTLAFAVLGFCAGAAIGHLNGHWLTVAVGMCGMGALCGVRRDGQA